MNRVQHIRHAFSIAQINALYDLLMAKNIAEHKEGRSLPEEEQYAMELLDKAKKPS